MRTPALAFALSLAVASAALVAMLAAQQPTPGPSLDAENILASTPAPVVSVVTPAELDSSPDDAVLAVLPNGARVVAVDLPANLPANAAVDVGEQAADSLRAVASGEITPEQASRDPTKTVDPGKDMVFPMLLTFAAAASRWALGVAVRRNPNLPNAAIGLISNGTVIAVVTAGFYLLHAHFPDLPQSVYMWWASAGLGSMAGSMAQSGKDWRAASLPLAAPTAGRR